MIYLISGKVNSGKTSRLLSVYNEQKQGDGFFTRKIYNSGHYAGQEIVRLSSGESKPFSFKRGFIPEGWDEQYRYDVYSFSRTALLFAQNIILDIIDKEIEPVFIDEIGPLELKQEGFFIIFEKLIKTNKDIYITVRESCINDIIKKFGLTKTRLITEVKIKA